MSIYLCAPAIAFWGGILIKNKKFFINRNDVTIKLYMIIAFFVPFIIYAFRDSGIGIDTISYVTEFKEIRKFTLMDILGGKYKGVVLDDPDIGFSLFSWIISRISSSSMVYLIFTSILINGIYARAIVKLSPAPVISVLIYFFLANFLYNLNIMRQAMAVGIILNGIIFLIKKEYWQYVFMVLLASTFHVFSIVCLALIVPIVIVKNKKQLMMIIVILSLVVLSSLEMVHAIVLRYFPHFDYYFRNNYHSDQRFGVTSAAYVCLDVILIVMLLSSFNKQKGNREIIIISVVCLAFAASAHIMMPVFGIYERISKFFHTFLFVAIPYAIGGISKKNTRQLVSACCLSLSFVYYLYLIVSNAFKIVPYVFGGRN